MRSVDKDRKVRRYTIPERCAWWLANVSALYDDQVLNRMLVCWVDDSEAQDREVFRRKMAERARRPGDGGDRFDLRVCRELWRRLRADGLVHVDVPFADRIRMASVRNRRNPEVLLDLIAGHALVRRFQRESERLEDGGIAVAATGDDFRYAARLFADLHTTGGSLEAKFDRNEQLVLSLAARNRVEQFTLHDVQRWTGWPYHKARRLMLGYESRGVAVPGPARQVAGALTLLDRTTSENDEDGRDVKQRQLVFLFDAEIYRESRPTGLVWLEPDDPEGPGCSKNDCCNTAVTPAVTTEVQQNRPGSGEGERSTVSGSSCYSTADHKPLPEAEGMTTARTLLSRSAVTQNIDINNLVVFEESNDDTSADRVTADVAAPVTAGLQQRDCCNSIDPHAFLALDGPAFEPCSACGKKPSHYRERRGTRRLCRRCYGAAVRREQRAGPPLPNAIDPAALRRVAASVGRCDVCGLERAAWSGQGVRLCETCYQRESRRAVEAGDAVVAV